MPPGQLSYGRLLGFYSRNVFPLLSHPVVFFPPREYLCLISGGELQASPKKPSRVHLFFSVLTVLGVSCKLSSFLGYNFWKEKGRSVASSVGRCQCFFCFMFSFWGECKQMVRIADAILSGSIYGSALRLGWLASHLVITSGPIRRKLG